jgi:hypothetical protein
MTEVINGLFRLKKALLQVISMIVDQTCTERTVKFD